MAKLLKVEFFPVLFIIDHSFEFCTIHGGNKNVYVSSKIHVVKMVHQKSQKLCQNQLILRKILDLNGALGVLFMNTKLWPKNKSIFIPAATALIT